MQFILFLLGTCFVSIAKAQLFQQNFSSSTSLSDYVSITPTNGQWDALETSDASAFPISITGDALRFSRAGSGIAHYVRSTDFSPVPSTVVFQFQLTVSGNTSSQLTAGNMQIGTNFDPDEYFPQAIANVHSRFGIDVSATPGNFSLRDIQNNHNSAEFSGTQIIRWVVNNSGSTQFYQSQTGNEESVGNDHWDLWIGNSKVFDEVSDATVTNALTDISFSFNMGTAVMDFDNFLIHNIPEVPTSLTGSILNSTGFKANWLPLSDVTGYRIDVATDPSFTNLVSGFDNLYVQGAATSSLDITGLISNTTYYYRVRAASQFDIDEIVGGNSLAQSVSLVSLPLTLLEFSVRANNLGNVLLHWKTRDEYNLDRFIIQRGVGGNSFDSIGGVKSIGSPSSVQQYVFTDNEPVPGINLYRLKIMDNDGHFRYSKVANFQNDNLVKIQLLQNPLTDHLNIVHPGFSQEVFVIVYNMDGREILRRRLMPAATNTLINFRSLPFGTYVLKIVNSKAQLFTGIFLKQ